MKPEAIIFQELDLKAIEKIPDIHECQVLTVCLVVHGDEHLVFSVDFVIAFRINLGAVAAVMEEQSVAGLDIADQPLKTLWH